MPDPGLQTNVARRKEIYMIFEDLRDRAALAALSGMVANPVGDITKIAGDAYKYADAFIAARYSPIPKKWTKAEEEARIKLFTPLLKWHREQYQNSLTLAPDFQLIAFTKTYQPKDGEDVITAFKVWAKN